MVAGGLSIVLAPALLGSCGVGAEADYLFEKAKAYRGGALYDKWWAVPKVKEAIEPGKSIEVVVKGKKKKITSSLPADNPYYVAKATNKKRRGSQTWRCKECHGWDYKGKDGAYGSGSHATGFVGILGAQSKTVEEVFDIIKNGGSVGKGHAFGTVLSDTDVADLVRFVMEGAVDMSKVVGPGKRGVGDAQVGKEKFAAGCVRCHGVDGKKINFKKGKYASEFIGNLANDNPWEFAHKVRFGQPDGKMPNGGVKGYVLKDVGDILAYAQSLAPKGLETASAVRGGVLYDTWWEVNGATAPKTTNAVYLDATYNTKGGKKTGAETWRCKECHGWDYKGKDGAYATGSHATGIKGVWASRTLDVETLRAAIAKGKMPGGKTLAGHAFEAADKLSSGDVADLVLFIREGLLDADTVISKVTRRGKGSATLGAGRFQSNCATCHGKAGTRFNFKHDEDDVSEVEYVGTIALDNPYELLHKIRFGQPGSDEDSKEMEKEYGGKFGHMPNALDAGYKTADLANLIAYCQTLPGAFERGGLAWDAWWKVDNVKEPIEPGKSIKLADGTVKKSSLKADNPLYLKAPVANKRRGSQTWRCKECHGWDLKGKDGQYGSGSHRTGFAGVWAARTKPAKALYDAIFSGKLASGTNTEHAFGKVLGPDVTRDLVAFIQKAVDVDRELVFASGANKKKVKVTYVKYDATTQPDGMKVRTRDANLVFGRIRYEDNCMTCHGRDGRKINFGESSGEREFVADIARDNPWELISKVYAGQPGSKPVMPNAAGAGYTADDIADLVAYIQQLP